ncbi:MAG: hypothetical protein ABJO67_11165 [Pseudoruegeria sp.]
MISGFRRIRRSKILTTALTLAWIISAAPSMACGFHTYLPEKTAVDLILGSEHLVIARNSGASRFTYTPIEVLRGTAPAAKIPQLVDVVSRRKLSANPDDGVLFAYDAVQNNWSLVAYLTPEYRTFVKMVMDSGSEWGDGYPPERLKLVEPLQTHPEPALRSLALREIDQAPYALLRTMDLQIPVDTLLVDLWAQNGYAYQPIRILLLGLTDEDTARAELYDFINRMKHWDDAQNLGPISTALVEIDGDDGITRLEQTLLSDSTQPLNKIEAVVEALAIHNEFGSAALRSTIADTMTRLVTLRPDTAPLIARQFGSRQDWSLARTLEPVVQNRMLSNTQDFLEVAVYVAQGRENLK